MFPAFLPHPPNSAWLPPIDPNDEVKFQTYSVNFRTRRGNDRRRVQTNFESWYDWHPWPHWSQVGWRRRRWGGWGVGRNGWVCWLASQSGISFVIAGRLINLSGKLSALYVFG